MAEVRDDTAAPAWRALRSEARRLKTVSLRRLFADDPQRFARLSVSAGDLLLDLSKNRMTAETLDVLAGLADASGLGAARDAMFRGESINVTERRAVLHTALRAGGKSGAMVEGKPVDPVIAAELDRFLAFAEQVRTGTAAAADGGRFSHVVNIGIGGSDLGPVMATEALGPYADGPAIRFISNVDPAHLTDVLTPLDPRRTLVLVASKTFTTQETMANALAARRWLQDALGDGVGQHMAALSTARDKVIAFGISPERMFGFWDWVGGRYSLWSAIGLSLAIAIGAARFREFLAGAHAMDRHFLAAPHTHNLPVLLALIGIWHRNGWNYPALAVLPYEQRLSRFPAYLQQLDMESNGKGRRLDGMRVPVSTGPIVFGEPGTNGQHAFYQLIHQGTDVVPCDFIVGAMGHEPALADQHAMLVAHALAQTEALMRGRTRAEAAQQLKAQGLQPDEVRRLAPHKAFSGNRPTSTILYPMLTPAVLGQLIALYEHKVFVQSVIWGINAFDQWGVELGKELASGLLPMVRGDQPAKDRDGSTLGLIAAIRARQSRR